MIHQFIAVNLQYNFKKPFLFNGFEDIYSSTTEQDMWCLLITFTQCWQYITVGETLTEIGGTSVNGRITSAVTITIVQFSAPASREVAEKEKLVFSNKKH